jgi:hypothetical protein
MHSPALLMMSIAGLSAVESTHTNQNIVPSISEAAKI